MVRLKAGFFTPTFNRLENDYYSPLLSSVAKQYSQVEKILKGHLPPCIPQLRLCNRVCTCILISVMSHHANLSFAMPNDTTHPSLLQILRETQEILI